MQSKITHRGAVEVGGQHARGTREEGWKEEVREHATCLVTNFATRLHEARQRRRLRRLGSERLRRVLARAIWQNLASRSTDAHDAVEENIEDSALRFLSPTDRRAASVPEKKDKLRRHAIKLALYLCS